MLKHKQFEQLCALAAGGYLSPEEQRQLDEHLEHCADCRAACEEFLLILRALPAEEGAADKRLLRHAEKSGLRERFLEAARAEGVQLPDDVLKAPAVTRWKFPLIGAYQWVAACAMAAVLLGYMGFRVMKAGRWHSSAVASNAARPSEQPARSEVPDAGAAELRRLRDASEQVIWGLKRENSLLLGRLEILEKQLVASQSERQNLSDRNAQLVSQDDQSVQLLAETKAELEKARNDGTATKAELAAEKAEVSELSQRVRLQAASLDRERELLAAGRDIRDIMGARQLYMIDVYDADAKGKNRKSFGRVFYTERKSLIFYAFDLDETKVANAKYSYELWGERLGQPASVKSLGLLYSDDKAQRRWVLKVDNPEELAEIDSVFVTIEPHEGGEKPSGKKILYAFLGGKANHP